MSNTSSFFTFQKIVPVMRQLQEIQQAHTGHRRSNTSMALKTLCYVYVSTKSARMFKM